MDRVNGRPCYCSMGAGGTPCIDRKYCDALREIERLRAALEKIAKQPAPELNEWAQKAKKIAREALQKGEL